VPTEQPDEFDLAKSLGFESFHARIQREASDRYDAAKNPLQFGVKFLDESLGGIFKRDLILLGAKTGLGKSQMAAIIAKHNALLGKRVGFIALEAEAYEIERRIKYQLICDKFYTMARGFRPNINLNFLDWYTGKFREALEKIELEVEQESSKLKTLHTFYKSGDYTAQDFTKVLISLKNELDLIIVDHLHFFQLDSDNENKGMKDLISKIRDAALECGLPILMLAHVRKSDKRVKQLIPDIEDFHGSSDIGKIATKAFTIAPMHDNSDPLYRKTYMQILKCRVDGSRNTTAVTKFNIKTQQYDKEYLMGKLNYDGTEFTELKYDEMPHWAISAKIPNDAPKEARRTDPYL
jgi:hypothetical protein